MNPNTTPVVDAVAQMAFEGNTIPHTWYKAITYDNGKPDINAIVILAEIVYWYRPTIVRDEATGAVVAVRKKFKADMLQRSYDSFAEQFGLSKRQCQDAVAHLVRRGLVHRELRTIDTPSGKVSNVPYFEPIPEALRQITYQRNTSPEQTQPDPVQRESYHVITGEPLPPNVPATTFDRETNTENTTETTTEITTKKKERKPAPLIPLPPTVEEEMEAKICEVLGRDPATMNRRDKGPVEEARKLFLAAGYKPGDLDTFWESWQQDWRYRRDRSRPSLKILREELGRIRTTMPEAKTEGVKTNGKHDEYESWPSWQPDDLAGAELSEV